MVKVTVCCYNNIFQTALHQQNKVSQKMSVSIADGDRALTVNIMVDFMKTGAHAKLGKLCHQVRKSTALEQSAAVTYYAVCYLRDVTPLYVFAK